jgi:hypothetical protein
MFQEVLCVCVCMFVHAQERDRHTAGTVTKIIYFYQASIKRCPLTCEWKIKMMCTVLFR